MDLISVIVPIYKVEPYLDRCVRSIVAQTYHNLEIILVDDGSPDSCPALCDAWAAQDSRIKVIHKENGGLSDARNAGLAVARGEYVAFVDSDDWISSDYIGAMHRAIRSTGAEIAACDVITTYGDADPPASAEGAPVKSCSPEDALEDILQGQGFRAVAWNKLYKKSLLENEGYPVGKYHEDEFVTYRILAKAKTLAYVDCPLYAYFQRPGSIMSTVSPKHLDALDAYLERLAFLRERYPALYTRDKFTFCVSCVSFYREIAGKTGDDSRFMKKKIKQCRKKVRFRFRELLQAGGRRFVYAVGSALSLDAFCAILNLRNKGKNNG